MEKADQSLLKESGERKKADQLCAGVERS